MRHLFADCELDTVQRSLRRGDVPVHVEPLVFDLLAHLVKHRGRLVTKEELLDQIWHGRIVSEAALTGAIAAARRAIGDTGEQQRLIRTLSRRGFRFDEPVEDGDREADPRELPSPLSSFLGREHELAALAALFRDGARLVTLTNLGGVGKTRLALKLANDLALDFVDGVRLVELAGVTSGEAVMAAAAGALGLGQRPGLSLAESISQALRPRHLLLVIDNCEHVADAAGALISGILRTCPRIAILATSREVLLLEGERTFNVPPLGCDGVQSPAVRLFIERACAAAPDTMLETESDAVVALCRELDGLPLAIELAAARVRTLDVPQIRHRLSERFRILVGAARDSAARHQTLHRAIAWSFDLLTTHERILLARASVFASGFTLSAAEAVCAGGEIGQAAVLDLLDALVRKSLITVRERSPEPRYMLLETIRQFAAVQLDETCEMAATRDRHAAWFAASAWENFGRWRSPDELHGYLWLEREFDNLRAAFYWARDRGQIDAAARIAASTGDMARFRLRDEASTWPPDIVEAARAACHPCLGILLTWCSSWAWSLGRLSEAQKYGQEAIAYADQPNQEPFAWAYTDLAMIAVIEGDHASAAALARAGAAHPADMRDRFCLAMLPYFLVASGHPDEARSITKHAVDASDRTDIPFSAAIARWSMGKALAASDIRHALIAFENAAQIARASGDPFWEIMASLEQAAVHARVGQPEDALRGFQALLTRWRHSRDLMVLSNGIGTLVVLLERLELLEPAAILAGALRWAHETSPVVPELPSVIARLRRKLGQERFEAAAAQGTAMTPREANDYALRVVSHGMDQEDSKPYAH